MAKHPEDLVIRILRDIQRTQAEHTKKFEAVDRLLDAIKQRLRDVNDRIVAALGLTTRAKWRDPLLERLNRLERRVRRLEAQGKSA
jgi:polyhydroxyalkanoate synthesis regulator phasin